MISLKNKSKGFTIVELLIVIVVIAILATLVIVTFTGIQQKARDSKRQTDIDAVDSHIEAFYANSGYYPSYADLSSPTWVAANLKGLDPSALQDPNYKVPSGGSGGAAALAQGTGSSTQYGYAPLNSSGSSCESDDTTCSSFTLTATLESGGTFVKKSNT